MKNNLLLKNSLLGTGIVFGIALALDNTLDSRVWEGLVVSKSALTVE